MDGAAFAPRGVDQGRLADTILADGGARFGEQAPCEDTALPDEDEAPLPSEDRASAPCEDAAPVSCENRAPGRQPLSFKRELNATVAREFLLAMFAGPNALDGFIDLVFECSGSRLDGLARFRANAEGIEQLIARAAEETRKGHRVYVGAGLRRLSIGPEAHATNADIIAWPALVWDFDSKEDAEYGLARARELGLGWHFVVQTGARRNGGEEDLRVQCWCLLDKPCTDMDRVRHLLKQGIGIFGSDKSIHDPRRVMRLPGSIAWPRKDGREPEVVCLRGDLI
jgi:hypothetical protein